KALSAALLKLVIGLEEIMKAKHEIIVIRPGLPLGPEDAKHSRSDAAPAGRSLARQARLRSIALQQFGEGVRSDPNARLGQIDVGEDAQDAPAVGRPARKGIDVQKVVARRQAEPPGCLFFRPKADPVELPASAIAG